MATATENGGAEQAGVLLARERIVAPAPEPAEGVPFWEQPWIAPALHKALFADLPLGWGVYFLGDATRWAKAAGGQDIAGCGLPMICLTDLVTTEDLSAAAPHLLNLTLPEDADPTGAHRLIFGPFAGQGVGIFLRAPGSLETLAAHLARLVLVPVAGAEMEQRRYFRFWDPAVLSVYLDGNRSDAEALGWMFRPDAGSPPLHILSESGPDSFCHWSLSEPAHVPRPAKPPELRPADIALFDADRQRKVCAEAMDWICETYGEKSVPRATLVDAALRQIAPLAKLGITSEYALRYVLAGFYLSGRSLRQLDKADHAMLSDPKTPPDKRAEEFLRAVQARTGAKPLPGEGGG